MTDAPTAAPSDPSKTPAWRGRTLVLIGLMGCGKSTVGRRLAADIGWRFLDADEEIEKSAGCSIAEMFATYGEPMFRDLEERVMIRLLAEPPLVLATGGGAWIQPKIRALIKRRATSLWLRAELDILMDRVSKRDHRPLLKNGDKEETMRRLMDERYPIYAEADITIDSSKDPNDRVVERAIAALKEYKL